MNVRIALFLVAAATLMLELLLTRAFDVILTPNMAYMVIACALFSFGLAGVCVAVWPPASPAGRRLPLIALLFAASTLAVLPILNALPFDYEALSEEPFIQLFSFAGMYLTLVVPFFLSGLIFTLLFSSYAGSIQTLYFWDLTGAAVGCVLMVPLLEPIGPGGILFVAAAMALVASGLFAPGRWWRLTAAGAAVVLVSVPFLRSPDYLDFVEHLAKRGVRDARQAGTIEFSRWDPISKIDVIDQTNATPDTAGETEPFALRRKHIAYDGGTQSSHIFQFDGNYRGLREGIEGGHAPVREHFWHRGVLASHYLRRDSGHRVLVLGSAAGQETKAALMYGAAHVDAVEMVRAVVEIMTGRYAEYSGGIFNDPRVRVHATEGRSFLRASASRYDVIQIHSNHTSSSVAAGTGAMSPNYLQTADAYREYFDHLSGDGVLHINHFGFARMITTAALAWRQMGRTDFQRHVAVFGMTTPRDTLPTLLVKMQPWTASQLADLAEFFGRVGDDEVPFELLQNPVDSAASFLPPELFSGDLPSDVIAKADVRIRPATDDQPFFNFLRKRVGSIESSAAASTDGATAFMLNSQLRGSLIPMDLIHLIVTGAVSLFFAAVVIVVPLWRSDVRDSAAPVKYLSMTYFSALGAGFIVFELVSLQIFVKLIGYPVYTYVLVIFTLLFGAGLGSAASRPLGISPQTRWWWPFAGIVGYGAAFAFAYPAVFNSYLASGDEVRLAVAAALLLPLGFFLGMPFPLGILVAGHHSRGAVAWAWGLNGFFTVVGSLASVLLGITIGFQATLLVAVGIYVVAGLAFAALRLSVVEARRTTAAGYVALRSVSEVGS